MTTSQHNDPSLPITEDGIWIDIRMAPLARPSPALFLDRDGVIVCDTGFLSDPKHVTIIPQVASLIAKANRSDIPVLVVTNQSGIDRGLFDWHQFRDVERTIADELGKLGACTNATAACPFHPDHTNDYDQHHAHWRKPGPGLILAIAKRLGISLSASWLIGDNRRDIAAAEKAGLAGGILISEQTGEENRPDPDISAPPTFDMKLVPTASRAAELALSTDLFDIS